MKSIKEAADELLHRFSQKRSEWPSIPQWEEIGIIKSVTSGVVQVEGLYGIANDELVEFTPTLYGIVFTIEENEIGIIVLGDSDCLQVGDEVKRTGRVTDVPVGEHLLGRIIDPLGKPLDGEEPLKDSDRFPIERDAPSIMDRIPVNTPLQTGIKVIDALIPIGRGQRELILGDRQTGKTAIAVDTIINQKEEKVICIYCAIGQRASATAKVVTKLKQNDALKYSIVVVTEGNDAPGLKYIAPYSATRIAEYFMDKGRDVLIIYDDLTQHALAYREISLLMRRPPGREAFPGDIFYLHSRLLERSTHLKKELGGGSLTALPIIETEAQNISAYIPTNLISITDGQLYLSPKLFELGILPAVDIGASVSRVGKEAQKNIYQSVVGNLKLAYSQFEELENFARFGTRLDDKTKSTITHGQRIRACLKQEESAPVSLEEQVLILLSLSHGMFDPIPLNRMKEAEREVKKQVKILSREYDLQASDEKLEDQKKKEIVQKLQECLKKFID